MKEIDDTMARLAQDLVRSENVVERKVIAELLGSLSEIQSSKAESVKLTAEAKKFEQETLHREQATKSEERKYYASLVAPLLSIVVLGLTLAFQFRQSRTLDEQRRVDAIRQSETAEDQRWKDTYGLLDSNNRLTSSMLSEFRRIPRYHDRATSIAWDYIERSNRADVIQALFADVLAPLNWQDTPKIYAVLRSRQLVLQKYQWGNAKPNSSLSEVADREAFEKGLLQSGVILKQLSDLIAAHRPTTSDLSFADLGVWDVDLSGANLSGVDLTRATLTRVQVTNADLSGVDNFEGLRLFQTAWWRAKSVSRSLQAYLVKNAPFDAATQYAGPPSSLAEFQSSLTRLAK